MKTYEIVVVEDNPADREWLEVVLREIGLDFHLTVADDGEKAIDCLLRRNSYRGAASPDAIFLDMHLPKVDGMEILRRVPDSAELPICILTSSTQKMGQVQDHFKRPISYFCKPISPEQLVRFLRSQRSGTDAE